MADAPELPILANAYGDLADGLRDLARSLQSGEPIGSGTAGAPTAPPAGSAIRDAVTAPVAGFGSVLLQAVIVAAVAVAAFQLWIELAPPVRGSL